MKPLAVSVEQQVTASHLETMGTIQFSTKHKLGRDTRPEEEG